MTPTRRWLMLLTLCLGSFMILLDTTIVYVATPNLMSNLDAPIDQVLWVINGYLLAFAALLITTGRLADYVGPKALFLTGLIVFTLASAGCGLSQNVGELILARAVQGVGGALLTPQTITLITATFPAERRGAAFGTLGAVVGFATVGGPTLGGLLVTIADWRWIFFLNVPVGILAVVATLFLVVDVRPGQRQRLDPVGVVLGTGALFLIVFGLIQGQPNGWDLQIWASIAAGVVVGIGFVLWEARARNPLVPLDLFRDRDYTIANGANLAVNFAMQSIFIPYAIYTQAVLGMTALQSGLTVAPLSIASGIVAPFAGRLADRIGGKYLLVAGLTLFSAGTAWYLAVAHVGTHSPVLWAPLALGGVGLGLTFSPMLSVAIRRIEPHRAAAASAVFNTFRQLGGVFGAAGVGAVLASRLQSEMTSRAATAALQLPAPFRAPFVAALARTARSGIEAGTGAAGATNLPAGLPAAVRATLLSLGQNVFDHSFVLAMRPTGLLAIAVLLAAALGCLFLLRSAHRAQAAPQETRGARAA